MLHTLQSLSKDFPNREFTLIIGADNWESFPKWYGYQEIIDHYSILIYPREGCKISVEKLPEKVSLIETELYNISSTEIRQRIKAGQSIKGMVPDMILDKVKEYWK